jgi:hypothetical protein
MVLPVVALVLAVPQLVGYIVWRLARRAGVAEWLAGAVAAYTAIWYPIFGWALPLPPPPPGAYRCGIGTMLALGTLLVGLGYQLLIGSVIATAATGKHRPAPRPR